MQATDKLLNNASIVLVPHLVISKPITNGVQFSRHVLLNIGDVYGMQQNAL